MNGDRLVRRLLPDLRALAESWPEGDPRALLAEVEELRVQHQAMMKVVKALEAYQDTPETDRYLVVVEALAALRRVSQPAIGSAPLGKPSEYEGAPRPRTFDDDEAYRDWEEG
jgi:hypothetical protein